MRDRWGELRILAGASALALILTIMGCTSGELVIDEGRLLICSRAQP